MDQGRGIIIFSTLLQKYSGFLIFVENLLDGHQFCFKNSGSSLKVDTNMFMR